MTALQANPRQSGDAMFRTDIGALFDDDLIKASIDHGSPLEPPPQSGINYHAFTDLHPYQLP